MIIRTGGIARYVLQICETCVILLPVCLSSNISQKRSETGILSHKLSLSGLRDGRVDLLRSCQMR